MLARDLHTVDTVKILSTMVGLLLAIVTLVSPLCAQMTAAAKSQNIVPSENRTESSLFYFLNMSGRQRADFRPLTPGEKARFYLRAMTGPVMFVTAAASAGIAQAEYVPHAWGEGAEGYGERFGNYLAKQAVGRTIRLGLEDALHEDNRYFSSGEHGFGRRIAYALKSSIMARGNDGRQHISLSEIGSIAGSSFVSRLWQPSTDSSAGDGAVSFGIGMASNAGTNVLREFLPDVTRHVFHRRETNLSETDSSDGIAAGH